MTTKSATKVRRRKLLVGLCIGLVALMAIAVIGYLKMFRGYPPQELMQDIKAGVAVLEIKDADTRFAKYLEGRYGPMSEAANREKAFLDFFNPEHIRALQFMVAHSPQEQRRENISATARWVAQFRAQMTAAERAALREKLKSDSGHVMLKRATAQYNAQDIYYRGDTAPVISELLRTIHEVQGNKN
ncbi:MAG: hypothetical protein U1F83_13005 [Verrucomicrobiota bacterium]